MDAKLKEKLNEAVEAALLYWKKTGGPGRKPVVPTTDPVVPATDSESEALTRWLIKQVRQKLYRTAEWEAIQKAMTDDSLAQTFARRLRPRARPVDPKQYAFPGFEIPEKIGSGKRAIKLPEARMSKFLAFVDGFHARSERDYKRAEELRRLAEKLRPFTEGDPTVADAFARASAQPVVLEIVKAR